MKTITKTHTTTWYRSEVRPEIETEDPYLSRAIEWADDHPITYEIVRTRKSRVYGMYSDEHVGWSRGVASTNEVIERISTVMRHMQQPEDSFMRWRANFVLEHYGQRGYTGGFFQQHAIYIDGEEYPRHCMTLDYTPELLEQVIDRFIEWTDEWPNVYSGTTRITLNSKNVREFPDAVLHVAKGA